MILLFSAALAADLDRFPLVSALDLPPTGVVRIELPPSLRSPDDPPDGTDLWLEDATGAAVPFAVLRGRAQAEAVSVDARPTVDPTVWEFEIRERPVDALTVTLERYPSAATVTVTRADGAPVGPPVLVWNLEMGASYEVPLPPELGRFRVKLRHHGPLTAMPPRLGGLRTAAADVPPSILTVPVSATRVEESGWARYDVELPLPLPVRGVTLPAEGDVFRRQVRVSDAGVLDEWSAPIVGEIERVRVGEAQVDRTTLSGALATDRLAVRIDAGREPPLALSEVAVHLEGAHLLVRDPGPGPHRLYAGAPPDTGTAWGLQAAAPELARLVTTRLTAPDATPNPDWVPPEVRGNLVAAGAPLDLRRMRWTSALQGPAGLARIALGEDVLATARPDLGDLRVIDAEGRQIPYLLRRRGAERSWGALPFTRTERGSTSVLEVPLPRADVPVATVTVRTGAPIFRRRLTVARPNDGALETLRAWDWMALDRAAALALSVEAPVGEALVVTIENGDDPPLPVEAVELSWPAWELVAALPEGGASLVWGDARIGAPDYDVALLQASVERRATVRIDTAPAAPLTAGPLPWADRAVLFGGIAILVAGLLGLTALLVRAAPEPEPEVAG